MSDAAIERERAAKAALKQDMAKEADEIEACEEFFLNTGGKDCWSEKWGWWDKSRKITTYSGVRVNKQSHVLELMLPFNGLDSSTEKNEANEEGSTAWGRGLNGLRYLESLNLHGNALEGSLVDAMAAMCAMTRADQFLKRPQHFSNLRNIDLCRNKLTGAQHGSAFRARLLWDPEMNPSCARVDPAT